MSFSPDLRLRYAHVAGQEPNHRFSSPSRAIEALLHASAEKRINLRSFRPEQSQGNEFLYGLRDVEEALSALKRLTAEGLFVIVNETIDVEDGGVSGVALADLVEFAPGATPRVVETGEVASLPLSIARKILARVYGFDPDLPESTGRRIEFSIHPVPRGTRHSHTVIWEIDADPVPKLPATLRWPNPFSELIGDKVFGLLVADTLGLQVPRTTVLCRRVRPFIFGCGSAAEQVWVRTCPKRPEPGLFPTVRGWTDPFRLLATDSDERLASVIIQEEVPAAFSGAVLTSQSSEPIIEGVPGFGDQFMLGNSEPIDLPSNVVWMLREIHSNLAGVCGSIRMEWAFDGRAVSVLQLQQEEALSTSSVVVQGRVEREVPFRVEQGLEALRSLVDSVKDTNVGIHLIGRVGMTSHIADVLRRSRVPSRMSDVLVNS